ncbi:MAG: hypothetical protein HY238_24735 [Acidobacteria bacterium]|nr:hypothetical protein [Acidobacteriota bacterium]
MFEVVEKHKRTAEETRVILLEIVGAIAILAVVGAVVWMLFFRTGG